MIDLVKCLYSLLALFCILIGQQAYEQTYFDKTLDFAPDMQARTSDAAANFLSFLSDTKDAYVSAPMLVCFLFIGQRSRAFYYLVMHMCISAGGALTKLNYHQGRPFWESLEVEALACTGTYGNPSGHSWGSLATSLTVFLDFNAWASARPASRLHAWYWRILVLVIGLTYSGSVAYSRILLGVHSLNQVLLGLQLGAWTAFTLHFVVREPLDELVSGMIAGTATDRLRSIGLTTLSFFVLTLGMECINYAVVYQFENPEIWTTNMKIQCDYDYTGKKWQDKALASFGEKLDAFGAMFGLILETALFPKIIYGELVDDNWWKIIARYAVSWLVSYPWLLVQLAIDEWGDVSNPWVRLFLCNLLCRYLCYISLFFLGDVVNKKIGLLKTSGVQHPYGKNYVDDSKMLY